MIKLKDLLNENFYVLSQKKGTTNKPEAEVFKSKILALRYAKSLEKTHTIMFLDKQSNMKNIKVKNESVNEESKTIKSIQNLADKDKYGTVSGTRMNGKTAKEIIAIYNHPKMKSFRGKMDKMKSHELMDLTIRLPKILGIKVESVNENMKDVMKNAIHQVKTFDKPSNAKLMTIKVINKLKQKRNSSKSASNKKELQKMIDKVEGDYKKGKYLKESVDEATSLGADMLLGGIATVIKKAGMRPMTAKMMGGGFKVSKRDKVGFKIEVEIRGMDKKKTFPLQFETEKGVLYVVIKNKPFKLGKYTMVNQAAQNLKKVGMALIGDKDVKRIA